MTLLKRIWNRITAYIPTQLPIGVREYNAWADSVLALTNLPDNESTRFALASTIPHQPLTKALLPRIYFARLLIKAAANQVAFGVMEEMKAAQQARIEAEKLAEATAQDAPNVQVQGP